MTLQELQVSSFLIKFLSGDEESYRRIESTRFDFTKITDTASLLQFLNAWGCRQFALKDHKKAGKALKDWFISSKKKLPSHSSTLMEHSDSQIQKYASIFDSLSESYASSDKNGRVSTVGPVGAAKTLFALRKNTFPPWDNPILREGHYSRDGEGYVQYLLRVKSELENLEKECKSKKIALSNVPVLLGRQHASLVKLVDEYLWLTITRGCHLKKLIQICMDSK